MAPYNLILGLSILYVCLDLTNFAEGKCAGRWAIHACAGGNGKRSGPPQDALNTHHGTTTTDLRRAIEKLTGNHPITPNLVNNNPMETGYGLLNSLIPRTVPHDTNQNERKLEKVLNTLSEMASDYSLYDDDEDYYEDGLPNFRIRRDAEGRPQDGDAPGRTHLVKERRASTWKKLNHQRKLRKSPPRLFTRNTQ